MEWGTLLPFHRSLAHLLQDSFDRALAYASQRSLEDSKRERLGGIRASLKVQNDEAQLERAAVLGRRRSILEDIEMERAARRPGEEAMPSSVVPKKDSPARRGKDTDKSSSSSSSLNSSLLAER